jgi:KaiC/GvpD/RAD55 family RecA-like ATPase
LDRPEGARPERVRVLAARLERVPETTARRLRRLDVGRMLRTSPPPIPWVAEGLLVRGCVTLLAGREGLGKSLFSLALAAGIITGDDTGPFPASTAGRVMVVDGENGESEIHRRLRALGLGPEAEENLVMFGTEASDLLNRLQDIEREIERERPALVILDSLRTLWAGSENDSAEVAPFIDGLRNLARRRDVAVLLLHHASRTGDYRGSTGIGAGCQVVTVLGREKDDPETDRFFLDCPKLRPATRWPRRWVRLAVEMGTLVCLESAEPPEGEEAPAPRPAREGLAPLIQRALDEAPEPLTRAAVARAVSRAPKDGTVKRVLDGMAAKGLARQGSDGRWEGANPRRALRGGGTLGTLDSGRVNPHSHAVEEGATLVGTLAPAGTLPSTPWRCPTCSGEERWYGAAGQPVCRRCHPPAPGAERAPERPPVEGVPRCHGCQAPWPGAGRVCDACLEREEAA